MSSYSFRDVVCRMVTPGGTIGLGMSEGTTVGVAEEGITFERAEDRNTIMVGINGEALNLVHAADHGTVRIRLLKTSLANGRLMDAYKAQKKAGSDWSRNNISLRDMTRGDKVVATEVAFAGEPSLTFGKVGTISEWLFHAGHIEETLTKEELTQRV